MNKPFSLLEVSVVAEFQGKKKLNSCFNMIDKLTLMQIAGAQFAFIYLTVIGVII